MLLVCNSNSCIDKSWINIVEIQYLDNTWDNYIYIMIVHVVYNRIIYVISKKNSSAKELYIWDTYNRVYTSL